MAKLNRPVTGSDGITRNVGDDVPDSMVENYRARGLLQEEGGETDARKATEANLAVNRTQQFTAGIDPHTGQQARGEINPSSDPGSRGSSAGANDVGLSAEDNAKITAEQTKRNEATVARSRPAPSRTLAQPAGQPAAGDADKAAADAAAAAEGGNKANPAPANKADQAPANK